MLIYFSWCQSFHYQPHFSEVYSLAIKMPEARGLDWTTGSCLSPFPVSRQGHPGRDIWPVCPETKAGVGGCHALTGGEEKTGPPSCRPPSWALQAAAQARLSQVSEASPLGRRAARGENACLPGSLLG